MLDCRFLIVGFILLRDFYHEWIEFCQKLFMNLLRQTYNYLKEPRHKRVPIELIQSSRSDLTHLWYRSPKTCFHWRWTLLEMGTGKLRGLEEILCLLISAMTTLVCPFVYIPLGETLGREVSSILDIRGFNFEHYFASV